MPTVLVTGGAGYIGSHTCRALAGAGFTPVTYDNLCAGHEWAVKWGPLERGDINDVARLKDVISRHRPQAVIHFASHIAAGESVVDPLKFYDNNVSGSLALLRAMVETGTGRLVFSSTAAVYGNPVRTPIDEGHPLQPINPYGATKLMIERAIADCAAAHGLGAIVLRYFNAAGASPDDGIGEAHEPETHLIPKVLDVALGRGDEVQVFGDDYPTADGTCVRDYIHVADLAEAHVLALARLKANAQVMIMNLGNGSGFSVKQVVEAAREVTGHALPVKFHPRRPGDPPVLVADAGEAARVLGWRPRRPSIVDQIADAYTFARRRSGL